MNRMFHFRCIAAIAFALFFGWAAGAEEEDAAFADIAEAFRKHCVRVFIHGKTHEGAFPAVGDFGDDIKNERPTLVGGYWWDENHVLIPDPVLQDQFIRSIAVCPWPGKYPFCSP